MEYLYGIVETLADALGACPYCWGASAECKTCHGRGKPGSRPPDAGLYAVYAAPAARRAQGAPENIVGNGGRADAYPPPAGNNTINKGANNAEV